ncbi:hypothetical protein ADUPG1_008888, partial [Aduncisulcus paluster]
DQKMKRKKLKAQKNTKASVALSSVGVIVTRKWRLLQGPKDETQKTQSPEKERERERDGHSSRGIQYREGHREGRRGGVRERMMGPRERSDGRRAYEHRSDNRRGYESPRDGMGRDGRREEDMIRQGVQERELQERERERDGHSSRGIQYREGHREGRRGGVRERMMGPRERSDGRRAYEHRSDNRRGYESPRDGMGRDGRREEDMIRQGVQERELQERERETPEPSQDRAPRSRSHDMSGRVNLKDRGGEGRRGWRQHSHPGNGRSGRSDYSRGNGLRGSFSDLKEDRHRESFPPKSGSVEDKDLNPVLKTPFQHSPAKNKERLGAYHTLDETSHPKPREETRSEYSSLFMSSGDVMSSVISASIAQKPTEKKVEPSSSEKSKAIPDSKSKPSNGDDLSGFGFDDDGFGKDLGKDIWF